MKKILIVDDSASIRDVLSFVLKEEGFEVLASVDGLDALKHLNGQHLDLIITDLYMPNMDGITLIKNIRSRSEYERTPILFLTTESQNEKKTEAKEAGATGWIVKPFVQKKLISAVMKVMK